MRRSTPSRAFAWASAKPSTPPWRLGGLLTEAKGRLRHGEWGDVAVWTWKKCRPIHDNNRRWHNNENFDLESRDAALVALRTLGISQKAIGELHGLTQGQVSKRLRGHGLRGHGSTTEGDGMNVSVTCRSCGGPFLAAKASALYCGATCRQRANRAKKGA